MSAPTQGQSFGYICVIYELPISRAHKLMIVTDVSTVRTIMFRLCIVPLRTHCLAINNWLDTLLKVGSRCLCRFLCCTTSCGKKPFFDFCFSPPRPTPSRPLKSPQVCAEDHGKSLSVSVICHALWRRGLISCSSVYGHCQAKKSRSRKCLHQRVNSLTCGSVTKPWE